MTDEDRTEADRLPPAARDDLDALLADALRRLSEGVVDSRSPFHTPTLGTTGQGSGAPELRSVVLRGFLPEVPELRFHTDVRSAKCADMRANPRVGLHVYSASAKVQVRLAGWATLHARGPVADAAWAASRISSRQCYGVEPASGETIGAGDAYRLPGLTAEEVEAGRPYFCAVAVRIGSMEVLHLAASGHRRAYFDWTIDGWSKEWLAP